MSTPTHLNALFAEYVSGKITEQQLSTLEAALREDSELRSEFIEYLNIDAAIGALAVLSESEIAEIDALEEKRISKAPARSNLRNFRIGAMIGMMAASVLIAFVLWNGNSNKIDEITTATLVTGIDEVLTKDNARWGKSDLPMGEYHLERGLVHLKFGGGVMVYIEAPARFTTVSDKRVVLHQGRLSANVPPEGIGFTVETAEAEVVDYGTEFSVESKTGSSEVHVFNGLVRVHPKTENSDSKTASVDLHTDEAVRIEESTHKAVEIELATDRFIRNFDEAEWKFPLLVKQLSPVARYRMAIRMRGLHSEPIRYSGEILEGDGIRSSHAPGFIGSSLRVGKDSTSRGGRVDAPPRFDTGQFTMIAYVYAKTQQKNTTVVTNFDHSEGNFSLSLNQTGMPQVSLRSNTDEVISCVSSTALPLTTWRQIIVTADGRKLRLYEDGQLTTSTECSAMALSELAPIWIGTSADGTNMWEGRIDELAFYDRALNADEVASLYQAAQAVTVESK